MGLLVRLGFLSMRHPIGRLLIGPVLIIIGLIVGITSHQVSFLTAPNGQYQPHALDDGTYLLQYNNSDTYYVIDPANFTPRIDDAAFKNNDTVVDLVYKNDSESVKYKSSSGTDVSATGYKVEKLELGDSNTSTTQTYTSSEYTQNPKGFYQNNWPIGGILIFIGVVILGLFLFVLKGKPASGGFSMGGKGQGGFGVQLPSVPNQGPVSQYGQPQNPAAFNQYGQPPQPGVPPQYGQPQYPGAPAQYGQPQTPGAPQYGQPQYPGAPSQYGQPQTPSSPQYGQPQSTVEPTQYAPQNPYNEQNKNPYA